MTKGKESEIDDDRVGFSLLMSFQTLLLCVVGYLEFCELSCQ